MAVAPAPISALMAEPLSRPSVSAIQVTIF